MAIIKQIITAFIIIMAISLLVGLGFWQLHRAEVKADLIESHQRLQDQKPLNATEILQAADPVKLRYYPVKLQGTALNDYPILRDNVIVDGHVGYRLYTPVLLDSSHVILVEREWIPQGPSRAHYRQKFSDLNAKYIEGYLDFAYRNRFVTSALESKTAPITWPLRIQTLDVTLLSQLIGKEVYPMLITPRIASSKTFPISPERHRGYAFQWFGLATALVIVTMVVYRTHRTSKGSSS